MSERKGNKPQRQPHAAKAQKPTIIFTGAVGTTHEFVAGGAETWPIYVEHLGIYFKANNIQDTERKKIILLTAMGSSTYVQLRKVCAPKKPEDLSYNQINQMLTNFFNPKPHKYVKRDEFNNRKQKPGETFSEFIADLNGMSEYCEFDNVEDAILGQILSGMRDLGLKKHLLQQPKLVLNDVKRKGIASDAAYNDARKMSGTAANTGAPFKPISSSDKFHRPNPPSRNNIHSGPQQHGVQSAKQHAPQHLGPPNTGCKNQNGPKHRAKNAPHQTAVKVNVYASNYPCKNQHALSQPQNYAQTSNVSVTLPFKKHCHRCGNLHNPNECPYMQTTCYYCKKKGHLDRMCFKLRADNARGEYDKNYTDDSDWEDFFEQIVQKKERNDDCCIS